ncbi:MAG: protein kinase domain-containing protein [Phycisphaerae bacterium]
MSYADHRSSSGHSDLSRDGLDAALRAAFRPAAAVETPGVIDTLTLTIGEMRRVILRDVESPSASPVVGMPVGGAARVGRYELQGEVGRGGVGVVYRTRDPDLGRDVALKVLRKEHADNPGMLQRFVEEAQIAGQLQHPGVLPVYQLGLTADRQPFFTMKLVQGRTLAALLGHREPGSEALARLLGVFEQVCQTIAYSHARGVIHRDLKPSNVLVGAFGEVQVLDWGLAKILTREGGETISHADCTRIETVRGSESSLYSQVGSVLGTPTYMSPEQARGEVDQVDERSDVFALGGILLEILTGQPPYRGSREQVLRMASEAALGEALGRLDASEADAALRTLVGRCLSARAEDRPRDAGVIAQEMSRYFAGLAERVRSSELDAARQSERVTHERRARRLTQRLGAIVVTALVIAGGSGALAWQARQEQREQTARSVADVGERVSFLLGQAVAAPVGRTQQWNELRDEADRLASAIDALPVEERGELPALIAKVREADADHRLVERIEEVVITGATHDDRDSWLWMEKSLREVFAERGVDLSNTTHADAVARIRGSAVSDKLIDGLELWIGTVAGLYQYGVTLLPTERLFEWMNVVYEVDPDPFRTKLRKLLYSPTVSPEAARELLRNAPYDRLAPRTMAWMFSLSFRADDDTLLTQLIDRALLHYPDDMMLNFDAAYHLAIRKEWQRAIRAYYRCLAIRPNAAGVWRGLGNALREAGEFPEAIRAIERSIALQPRHAWTLADLSRTQLVAGDFAAAERAAREAVAIDADVAIAQCALGRSLMAQDKFADALASLERGHELGRKNPQWNHPSQQWIDECKGRMSEGK